MFAQKIAEAQAKATEGSAGNLQPKRPTGTADTARSFVTGTEERRHGFRSAADDQAPLRVLSERASSQDKNGRFGDYERGAAPQNMMVLQAPHRATWDFSKTRIYPLDLTSRSQASRSLSVPPSPDIRQPKFTIGRVDDPLEREADHIADRAMSSPLSEHFISPAPTQLSRKCAACEEEEKQTLQAKPAGTLKSGSEAPAIVHEVLRSPGQPLNPAIRSFMESRFRHDFGRVRVHADNRAADSARTVNALAYTVGGDIVFGSGQYAPSTKAGQRLLAHELAHVMQQRSAPSSQPVSFEVASPTSVHEVEADRMAATALLSQRERPLPRSRHPVSRPSGRALLQRSVSTEAAFGIVAGAALLGTLIGGLAAGPGGALAGFLVGAAIAGGSLLAESLISKKSKPADSKPDLLDDPKVRAVFEAKLREGLAILHTRPCKFPKGTKWRYDQERWMEGTRLGSPTEETQYRYKGATAAAGIDDLFANLQLWDCDCAMYTEIATLYAVRHALGTAEFNRRFPDMRLRRHESVGVPRETQTAPIADPGDVKHSAEEQAAFDQYWVDSPVGTEVSWENNSGHSQPNWEFEHAIKVVKGSDKSGAGDRYDAHPISAERYEEGKTTELTEDEIKLEMSRNSNDAPAKFNPTPATWKELQDAGIAADIIGVVQSANIGQFRTNDALVKGVIEALKASPKKVSIDGKTMQKLVEILLSSSDPHDPSLKSELDAYVRQNIVRHNVSRLRLAPNP